MHGNVKLNTELTEFIRDKGHLTPEFLGYVAELIREKLLDELTKPHGEGRDSLSFGLSRVGGCTRYAQLAPDHEPEFTPGTLWTFFLGHYLEPLGLALLRGIGFKVVEPQAEVIIPGPNPDSPPLFHSWTDGIVERADYGRKALSVKTMGLKGAGWYGGKVKRRGFAALVMEGASPRYYAQSMLEAYGLRDRGVDGALILIMAKEFGKWMEVQDDWQIRSGSASFWTDVWEVRPDWVEKIAIPVWQRAQDERLRGELGPGLLYDGDRGVWSAVDPREKNAVNGWNICKWSTGQCDLYDVCLNAHKSASVIRKAG